VKSQVYVRCVILLGTQLMLDANLANLIKYRFCLRL